MAFKEIEVLRVDHDHIEQDTPESNQVIVPYILSDTPPDEWKRYFETHAPVSAKVQIVGNIARYVCQNDTSAIEKYGTCWRAVVDLVDDANRYYLGLELRRQQELGRKTEREERRDVGPSEYEREWDRYMGRD
jgi:hypothetical protein